MDEVETAYIKASPEYLMHGTQPSKKLALCPQCRVHIIFNARCAGCGYRGPGHVYTLELALQVIPR